MSNPNIWLVLGIVAFVSLIIYWSKRGAVWGGLTLGIVLGFFVAIYFLITGRGFSWISWVRCAIVATLVGVLADWLGKGSDLMRKQ